MERDFNEQVNRFDTNSIKYDMMTDLKKPEGTIPMWVADMDFKVPIKVQEAVEKVAGHGIYGYSRPPKSYYKAVVDWYKDRYEFSEDDIVTTPGVVPAIGFAVRAFTEPGDAIMIQRPVYDPFTNMVVRNERKLVNNPLLNVEGRYIMNVDDFEQKIIDEKVKMFILCNPHNPVGRVWTKEELLAISKICRKHHVLVVSDEIHADFIYDGRVHQPFASVEEGNEQFTITCSAPSKTFNLAGLQTSNIIIPNKELKEKYVKEMDKLNLGMIGPMGIAACEAAYTYGKTWLEELKAHIVSNRDYLVSFVEDHLPELVVSDLEGTYLIWIDMTGLAMTNEEMKAFMANEARLWIDEGDIFGEEGENFIRVNLACTRETLEKALLQLEAAVLKRYN